MMDLRTAIRASLAADVPLAKFKAGQIVYATGDSRPHRIVSVSNGVVYKTGWEYGMEGNEHFKYPERDLRMTQREAIGDRWPDVKFTLDLGPDPLRGCNDAVRKVLDQRGKQYTPAEGRSQVQAEMNDAVRKALAPFRPEGLPLGCEFIETQLAGKFTRALEQAWNGTYSGDNTLDFGGYSACLAAKISKTQKISEVVK